MLGGLAKKCHECLCMHLYMCHCRLGYVKVCTRQSWKGVLKRTKIMLSVLKTKLLLQSIWIGHTLHMNKLSGGFTQAD